MSLYLLRFVDPSLELATGGSYYLEISIPRHGIFLAPSTDEIFELEAYLRNLDEIIRSEDVFVYIASQLLDVVTEIIDDVFPEYTLIPYSLSLDNPHGLFDAHFSNPSKAAHVEFEVFCLAKTISSSDEKGVVSMAWYVPIEKAVTINVNDSLEIACGRLRRGLSRVNSKGNATRVEIHHLIVLDNDSRAVGIIGTDEVDFALARHPNVADSPGENTFIPSVGEHMTYLNDLLKVDKDITQEEAERYARRNYERFRQTRAILIIERNRNREKFVGFATEVDLFSDH